MFKLKFLKKKNDIKKIRKIGNKIIEMLGSHQNITSAESVCGFIKVKLVNNKLVNETALAKLAKVWKKSDHILLEFNDMKPEYFIYCYQLGESNNAKNNNSFQKIRKIGNKIIESLGKPQNITSIESTCGFVKVTLVNNKLVNETALAKLAKAWKKSDHILLELNNLKPENLIDCYELSDDTSNFVSSVRYESVNCDSNDMNNEDSSNVND